MALDKTVSSVLNEQINKELYSAYLYLTFADYFEDRGLKGYANWYMIQVQEEVDAREDPPSLPPRQRPRKPTMEAIDKRTRSSPTTSSRSRLATSTSSTSRASSTSATRPPMMRTTSAP